MNGIAVNEEIITQEPRKTLELGKAWQPTFDANPLPHLEAQPFLTSLGDFGNYENVPEPDIYTYFEVTNTKKKTKPGPDGLPYSAYGNRHSADTLLGADKEMRTGVSPPFDV